MMPNVMNVSAMSTTNFVQVVNYDGAILVAFVIVGLLAGALLLTRLYNTHPPFRKFIRGIYDFIENYFWTGVGSVFTVCFVGGAILFSSDPQNQEGIVVPAILFIVGLFAAIFAVACIGYATKPVWDFLEDFASGKKNTKSVVANER